MSDELIEWDPGNPGYQFANAPVVTVACRCSIDPPIPICVSLLDHLRPRLNGAFPIVFDGAAIEIAPAKIAPEQHGPIPALFFTDLNRQVQIVLQSDVVAARWIRMANPAPYPGFVRIRDAVAMIVDGLKEYAPGSSTPIAHLTYTDMLFDPDLRSDQIVDQYFNEKLQIGVCQGAREMAAFNINWIKDDDVNFRITFQGVPSPFIVESGASVPVRLIEWSAMRLTGESDFLKTVFNALHRSVHETFVDVISDHAKREWGFHAKS